MVVGFIIFIFQAPDTNPDAQDRDENEKGVTYNEDGELDIEYVDANSDTEKSTTNRSMSSNKNQHGPHISQTKESGEPM